jgi:rRNA maturation endonuclease Nob1
MKWIECQSCGTEYRVVSDCTQPVEFCPYCGDPTEAEDDEDEDYDFDD